VVQFSGVFVEFFLTAGHWLDELANSSVLVGACSEFCNTEANELHTFLNTSILHPANI